MMADLPIGFWSGWIVVLTCVSLATLVWVVLSVYFSPPDVKTGDADAKSPYGTAICERAPARLHSGGFECFWARWFPL